MAVLDGQYFMVCAVGHMSYTDCFEKLITPNSGDSFESWATKLNVNRVKKIALRAFGFEPARMRPGVFLKGD